MVTVVTQVAGSEVQYTTEDIVDLTTSLKTNESAHWVAYPYGYIKSTLIKDKNEEYQFW